MNQRFRHGELTQSIIGAYYDVYNGLGYGFLEKVYENALAIELRRLGHDVRQQGQIEVYYAGQVVGAYYADLLVNDLVIVELKAANALGKEVEAQLMDYLKATRFEVGLLFNFGPEPKFVRKILDNARKGPMTWLKEGPDNK
jgi:GxxExxY protein